MNCIYLGHHVRTVTIEEQCCNDPKVPVKIYECLQKNHKKEYCSRHLSFHRLPVVEGARRPIRVCRHCHFRVDLAEKEISHGTTSSQAAAPRNQAVRE